MPHSQVTQYIELFVGELSLYRASFLKKAGLRRVVLCSALNWSGEERSGLACKQNSELYFDITAAQFNDRYQRTVIHHELYHLVDFAEDGQDTVDETWRRLNGTSYVYKKRTLDFRASMLVGSIEGFLTSYATTNVAEDKAETYSNMVVSPKRVRELAASDLVLSAKVSLIRKRMLVFHEDMNGVFWDGVDVRDNYRSVQKSRVSRNPRAGRGSEISKPVVVPENPKRVPKRL